MAFIVFIFFKNNQQYIARKGRSFTRIEDAVINSPKLYRGFLWKRSARLKGLRARLARFKLERDNLILDYNDLQETNPFTNYDS